MLLDSQKERLLKKLKRFAALCDKEIFTKIQQVGGLIFETETQRYTLPTENEYVPIEKGEKWGKEASYAFFKAEVAVDAELAKKPIYVLPHLGGYEGMLFVNGEAKGAYATKIVVTGHGNHYVVRAWENPVEGERLSLVLEFYAGHFVQGTQPFEEGNGNDFSYTFQGIDLCHKNEEVLEFIYDFKTLLSVYEGAQGHGFRKNEIFKAFEALHQIAPYTMEDKTALYDFFAKAKAILKPLLAKEASEGDGEVSICGHSHMDTAWLWRRQETTKKCARTYANVLNYGKEYKDYKFLQSSTHHLEIVRQNYPQLFEEIKKAVAEDRFESNGGCFIECDCNITGGEYLIRQFLWGQRFTQAHFNKRSDCFFLPDTFGYSASIPALMKDCGIDYFLTTKLVWNDTNTFPYESFWWEGIDGTRVLTHFNITHDEPSPEKTIRSVAPNKNVVKTGTRFYAFGQGDGGGGPDISMLEYAKRSNVLGAPRGRYQSLSGFMNQLERDNSDLPTHRGELYLELHRATLTNHPTIKKNNRKAEILLHTLEALRAMEAVREKKPVSTADTNPLLETILINQFHDILPGTCIEAAHKDCREDMFGVIAALNHEIQAFSTENDPECLSVFNSAGCGLDDLILLEIPRELTLKDRKIQTISENGTTKTVLAPLSLKAFETQSLRLVKVAAPEEGCNFKQEGNTLLTPYYRIIFDENGYMSSLYDLESDRELATEDGFSLGSLLSCENVPSEWDNWDIDADTFTRFSLCTTLLSSKIISSGSLAHVVENSYQLSKNCSIITRISFYAHTKRIDFDTKIDITENNRFIKAAFDVNISAQSARYEIQFGNLCRDTSQNSSLQRAAFEVPMHKYCDISEPSYGVSLLNDCKYGISANKNKLWISLHYSGSRPDKTGDVGSHTMQYSLLPHDGYFSADTTVVPAYNLNYKPTVFMGSDFAKPALVTLDKTNIIIETIKACEDEQCAVIVRMYEAEGSATTTTLCLDSAFTLAMICNMLEEDKVTQAINNNKITLKFKPFEVKTIKLFY